MEYLSKPLPDLDLITKKLSTKPKTKNDDSQTKHSAKPVKDQKISRPKKNPH